ncbi:TetR/AcrR family transcriptional regulator C-terminal domain-containing protein [Pseudoalteromonas espejiana]
MYDLLRRFFRASKKAGVLKGDELNVAAKQFVYQLKSFVFYPLLYGFETVTEQQNNKVIEQTVSLFLAKYKA